MNSRCSSRLPASMEANALSRAVASIRATGRDVVDLTNSNPTQVGLAYPADLLEEMADRRAYWYEPAPRGLKQTREAVAADYLRRGAHVDPDSVVLSASTSEAYSWLFKLLCDPGDAVLVPQPSYPLLEHLTRLEAVRLIPYRLHYHGRWEVDFDSITAAPEGVRALLVVSPNNPTGSYLSREEASRIASICAARDWALVADEVFADYPLDVAAPATELALGEGVLSFTLGGASKSLGLPQIKLAWTVVAGPAAERDRALSALELIADTFLSVGTPVQIAAPGLLARGDEARRQILGRLSANLGHARRIVERHRACSLLEVGGGWSLVVRVPATVGEERLTRELVLRERVLVHPGYFFDFPHEAYVVVSLLPPERIFQDAFERTLELASNLR